MSAWLPTRLENCVAESPEFGTYIFAQIFVAFFSSD